jgi:hypothetical protein
MARRQRWCGAPATGNSARSHPTVDLVQVAASRTGTIGVIELSTGQLALRIDQDMTPVGPQMVFDETDGSTSGLAIGLQVGCLTDASHSWFAI